MVASPAAIQWIIPVIVALTGILMAVLGQRALHASNEDLTRVRFQQETHLVADQVGRALSEADPLISHLASYVQGAGAELDEKTDPNATLNLAEELAGAVRAHEAVVYASMSLPSGGFLGAYLDKDGKLLFQLSRAPDSPASTDPTRIHAGELRRYAIDGSRLVEVEKKASDYDPRKRGFYTSAVTSKKRIWTDPYLFYDDRATGITRAEPVYRAGTLLGVLTVDFNIRALSSLVLAPRGTKGVTTLLHTDDGTLLAVPEFLLPKDLSRSDHPLRVEDLHDPVFTAFFAKPRDTRQGWLDVHRGGGTENVLALSSEAGNVNGIHWSVTSFVPESVHSEVAKQHQWRSMLALFGALVLSVFFGTLVARYMQRAKQRLANAESSARAAQASAQEAETRAQKAEGLAKQLGSYELMDCLGKGGMGEVWRARHRLLPRGAAVKLIRPEFLAKSDSREVQARFRREARSLAQLRSRSTVTILDYGIADNGALFLVMELLDGFDLHKMMKFCGPMPVARVLWIMDYVCASLAEAHAIGYVHRDLKPANIFLARANEEVDIVKVLDFGLVHEDLLGADARTAKAKAPSSGAQGTENPNASLARPSERSSEAVTQIEKPEAIAEQTSQTLELQAAGPLSERQALEQRSQVTKAGTTMGTPSYMAPEQVLGSDVGPPADVYSLGGLMVFLLTGRTLYDKDDDVAQMMAHVVEAIPDFASWSKTGMPDDLELVMRRCLEKEPTRRYPSASELREALRAVAAKSWSQSDAREAWSKLPKPQDPLKGPSAQKRELLMQVDANQVESVQGELA
jgi:serine/threonine protein kinase